MSDQASTGVELIGAERQRQITVEGWTAEHDDQHQHFELTRAAVSYALDASQPVVNGVAAAIWPWSEEDWRPADRRRSLIKAGALLAAELDRMERL